MEVEIRRTRPGGGTLFLVVGPSGAGKDTLMARARDALPEDRYHFARRVITRRANAGDEEHEAISEAGFTTLLAQRELALNWSAHGLRYGIRRQDTEKLADGTHLIANVSRAVLATARVRFDPVRVIQITASAEVLRERLRMRGRESPADIEARLARATASETVGDDVVTIFNDGAVGVAAARFIATLKAAQAAAGAVSSRQ